jgi:uncharacterized protein (DUF2126 family)/transglutaminase-like putative cysteine protease
MAIRVALNHQTTYRYDRPVALSPHVVRLRPAPHCRTPILAYSLGVEPADHFINWQQDPFSNYLARLVFPERASALSITVDLVADMTVINPFDFFLEGYAQHYPFRYPEQLALELVPYCEVKEHGPRLLDWLAHVDRRERPTVDFLVDLNRRLQHQIAYTIRMEPGIQTCEETMGKASGSCRDSGWLLVQILRHLGLAARFVSGYLVQLVADVKPLDGPAGPTADFTDLHAWAEVYVPGAGWIGLDPTSGLFAGEGHIPLACTPDPSSAAPISGTAEVATTEFSFFNRVQRIHEDPRVTKPYSEEEWAAIDALGVALDAALEAHDVRLTMGGEPTFVSIDDMDGDEWNSAALGPAKRRLAGDLLRRLQRRFAPSGVLHYGQGKWYPGEPLPRWALACFWRADGAPVWQDPTLMADESRGYAYTVAQAERFVRTLALRLGLSGDLAIAGYEDVLYYLWKEGTLPVNLDPLRADLEDPMERRRLAELLTRGLGAVTGYALPLRWVDERADGGGWQSGHWTFRRGRMYLTPGDSPMGYRLPLDSLPWLHPAQRDPHHERSVFEPRAALGDVRRHAAERYRRLRTAGDAGGGPGARRLQTQEPESAPPDPSNVVRTALCVEPRRGNLYVFLPPLTHLEHYLDLLACVESTAAAVQMPLLLEGYEPPRDWRLRRFHVTPDPGVIEVNIHPAHDWAALRDTTGALYEEAHASRLGTEKFMLDGRHAGTGGGNHVTIGGATPADSPFLRRPDLLRSLLAYWQNHPSLSYLFSGLFVGPTSQAPRVDEARDESLYELEIAFQHTPGGDVAQPWLVDRLYRHLLTDITGNTHRAEFCIDKLYSPDSATGRLGLVEFRAFEMPPHARMSIVQQLLLRALIVRFWQAPYTMRPVAWNTELHDRFLLPHYVWQDFADVVCELRAAGYPFALEWFAPFFEFRFPHYGTINVRDLAVELRMAIEPWPVLGEEVVSQGTTRFVDSSLERMQVRVSGMTDGRHVVACNGRRVPLRATGTRGECVAGVRYRAWQPAAALHPTIGVHTPLVFDIIDTWNGRSVGGCTYHVGHPGGRHYETFPVNANEAEARRIARFWAYGHTPGPMQPPPEERNAQYPYTLDLRFQHVC